VDGGIGVPPIGQSLGRMFRYDAHIQYGVT
jgi:hypothetical protein